jgi:hypothetical protein
VWSFSAIKEPPPAVGEALIVKKNNKYNVSCLFYGDRFTHDAGTLENAIKYVMVRDDATGEEAKYEPSDPATIESSLGFYADVWSPDEEYSSAGKTSSKDLSRQAASYKSTFRAALVCISALRR